MLKQFQHIIMFAIVLFSVLKAGAQMTMPDYVYIGSIKHYNVDPATGSTYTWKIEGLGVPTVSSITHQIDITWNTPGKFVLSVQEHSATGCDGPVKTGEVYVYQFTLSNPFIECVENIRTATYNIVKKEVIVDRPDYFTFKPGDISLDLSPSNFADFIPSSCPVEIHWQIDFSPTSDPITHNPVTKPSVSGNGQPSTYGSEILFPGDGVDFNNVVHAITYQIVDCNGHISYSNTQTITIKPRPKIL